jgi:hypothetical protein
MIDDRCAIPTNEYSSSILTPSKYHQDEYETEMHKHIYCGQYYLYPKDFVITDLNGERILFTAEYQNLGCRPYPTYVVYTGKSSDGKQYKVLAEEK